MKKKMPAAVILTMIALVAALAMAATNALTKGPINERAQAAIRQACETVMAAESYEELDIANGGQVQKLFAAKNGDEAIGYVAVTAVSGYGGPVETTIGLTKEGRITAVSVGGISFAETPGLGSKVTEAAFTEQFSNMNAPVTLRGIDAIGGATISSRAVVDGINLGAEAIAERAGITLAAAGKEEKPAEEPVKTALEAGRNIGTAQGYQSEVTAVVTIAEDGTVEAVQFKTADETPGFGTRIAEDEAFATQFFGKAPPFEIGGGIDAVAGATVTSKAAVAAINSAEPSAETVLAEGNGAKLIIDEDGRPAIVTADATFTGAVKLDITLDNGDITVHSFEALAGKQSTAEVNGNTAKAIAKGYKSNVSATITIDENGKIAEIKMNSAGESEYVGDVVGTDKAFIAQFVGKTGHLAFGEGIDAVAGATVTSEALLAAINDCLLGLGVAEAQEVVSTAEVDGNTAKAVAKGFKSNVSATVTVDEDGKITEVKANTGAESEYVGDVVGTDKAFLSQFIGQSGTLAFGDGLDAIAGATITSEAVLAAINDCLLGIRQAK